MTLIVLKKLATKRWSYFTAAVVVWTGFVTLIPYDLNYPWFVFNVLLGLLLPFFWYKILNTDYRVQLGRESATGRTTRTTTTIKRSIYFALGAASWAIFISNIPPHPADPELEVRGIMGFLAAFLWLAAAYMNAGNNSFWRICLGIDKPRRDREPKPKNARNRMGWLFFIWAVAAWIFFVSHVPFRVTPWFLYVLYSCLVVGTPYLFICALYLNIHCEQESGKDSFRKGFCG